MRGPMSGIFEAFARRNCLRFSDELFHWILALLWNKFFKFFFLSFFFVQMDVFP